MSPAARIVKARKPFEANSFYLQRQGVEEFKIASITIKPSKFKRNKRSQQARIQIIKEELKSEKEIDNKIIKVGEIKVCVTPNGSRLKKNAQFSDTVEEELLRLNSKNQPTYDVFDKMQRNFDLEREVNYIPNAKLSIPFNN
jgi:metal-dependent hydrolase (beta-lactamase superfamily II)